MEVDGRPDEISNIKNLQHTTTAQSVTIPKDVFEKLYLAPERTVKGDLRQTFGNPTPIVLVGLVIASAPLGCALMGWKGAGGGGAATVGAYYFFGGVLHITGGLMHWILGNTFPFVVFVSLGGFWLTFGATLTPFYNAQGAFTAGATTPEETAAGLASYQASFAFIPLFMGIIVFMWLVCALRTNLVLFGIILFLDMAFWMLTAAFFSASDGNLEMFSRLATAAGAFIFALNMLALYLLFAQLLESVAFPFQLPVGDLSTRFGNKRVKTEDEKV